MTLRRIGALLFLSLLAACGPDAGGTVAAGPPPTEAVETTTTSTSTSTTTTTSTSTTSTSTTVARPVTTPVTVATTVPVARLTPTTRAPAACDPNYSGACVPIDSDVDCGGGSGNGPSYVYAKRFQVTGSDIYGLDSDNDGIACES